MRDWQAFAFPHGLAALGWVALALSPGLSSSAHGAPPTLSTDRAEHPQLTPPTVLNEVSLAYPAEAAAQGLHGNVSVLVTVSPMAEVLSIEFESGADAFRAAALDAASKLLFSPALNAGVPVTATTRIRFHFAPSSKPGEAATAEYIVHAKHPDLEDIRARTTLTEADLQRSTGKDLARTVTQVPGVRMASGTNTAAKPIIRGHHERRLLVLYDGVRHESQKWGPDHATEIDPFTAGSISVIRGAAGARYGPDAIGGVILVSPPPLSTTPGATGTIRGSYATNAASPYGAMRLDVVPKALPNLTVRVEGNASKSSTMRSPNYLLGNTASSTWNAGATVGYRTTDAEFTIGAHHYDHQAGLYYGILNSSPAEFEAQLDRSKPLTSDLWEFTSEIDRPSQDVSHDIVTAAVDWSTEAGTVEAVYAYQHNDRKEYEQVRGSITGAQYDFTLRTHSLDAIYMHPNFEGAMGAFEGGFGLQANVQENVYTGYSLLPNYRSFSGGLFAIERLSLPRFDVEAGARYDTMHRAVYLRSDDFQGYLRRGTFSEDDCEDTSERTKCPSNFHTGSVSLGGLFHLVPDTLDLKAELSSASRFPNIDEHFLLGYAPSFPVSGAGQPDLGIETSWGGSLTVGLRTDWLNGEVSGFGSYVDDYIYFSPELDPSGSPAYDVTIRGTWPRYSYSPIQATLYGVDGLAELGPEAVVGLDVRGSLVRGRNAEDGEHLIRIPADQITVETVGRLPEVASLKDAELRFNINRVQKQSLVDPNNDFAPPPDGYTLLGLSAQVEIDNGKLPLRMGVEVHNLMNVAYREYLSLLRYYADQPGRDIRLWASASF